MSELGQELIKPPPPSTVLCYAFLWEHQGIVTIAMGS